MTRNRLRSLYVLGAVVALLIASGQQASAGPILSPITAAASSTFDGDILHTIDHTGLLTNFISGVTDFDTYIAGNPTHAGPNASNAWSAAVGNLPINLDYGLGASYSIGDLALWTSFGGFSINRFSVFTATNAGFVGATNVGSFDANDTSPVIAQVFALAPSVGSFLRIQILSNEGAGFVNLSEIGVEVTSSAVPEPTTLVLLGTGLAAVVRRRLRGRTRD
jgi:PEP-CTERM motif